MVRRLAFPPPPPPPPPARNGMVWYGVGEGGGVAEQNRVYLEAQGCELHECYAHPHTELEQAYRVQTRQRAVLVRLGKRSHRHLL